LRISTGLAVRELRGIMVERNISGVTASQSNRDAEDQDWVTLKHMAEDYSKAATADGVVAICQSVLEKESNLARLFLAKNRDEEDGVTVLISQGLPFGQFILDSTRLKRSGSSKYWKEIDSIAKKKRSADKDSSSHRNREH